MISFPLHSCWAGWPCAWTAGGQWLGNTGPLPGNQNGKTGGNWKSVFKACKVSYRDASRVAEQCDSHMVCSGPGIGGDREKTSGLCASTKIWLVKNNNMHTFTNSWSALYSKKLLIVFFVTSFNSGTFPPKLPDDDPLDQLENLPQQKEEVRWQE